MKKRKLGLMMVILLFAVMGNATVWHVNNTEGVIADFTALQTAFDDVNVVDGDTLYVYGSTTSYGGVALTKRLCLIGPGYFLAENPDTQAIKLEAYISTLSLNSGSENSFVTGLFFRKVTANASDVVISKNRFNASSYNTNLSIAGNNIVVDRCYFYLIGSYECIKITGSNAVIINNIIYNQSTSNTYRAIDMEASGSALISNNVIRGNILIENSTFTNNIHVLGSFIQVNSGISYNLCSDEQLLTWVGDNNQCNIDMTTVFEGDGITNDTNDGGWELADGSPAIGAGYDGDCGAFAGDTPYKLSGIPDEIPAIYLFSAPAVGFDLPIEIKAKSHD